MNARNQLQDNSVPDRVKFVITSHPKLRQYPTWQASMSSSHKTIPFPFQSGRRNILHKSHSPEVPFFAWENYPKESGRGSSTPILDRHLHTESWQCHQAMVRKTPAMTNNNTNSFSHIDVELSVWPILSNGGVGLYVGKIERASRIRASRLWAIYLSTSAAAPSRERATDGRFEADIGARSDSLGSPEALGGGAAGRLIVPYWANSFACMDFGRSHLSG